MNIVYNSPFYYSFFFWCCFCVVFVLFCFVFGFFFRLSGCFWRVFWGVLGELYLTSGAMYAVWLLLSSQTHPSISTSLSQIISLPYSSQVLRQAVTPFRYTWFLGHTICSSQLSLPQANVPFEHVLKKGHMYIKLVRPKMMVSTNYCKPEIICPVLFSPNSPSISVGELKTVQIPLFQITFFSKHNLALANLRRGESRIKGENYMRRK